MNSMAFAGVNFLQLYMSIEIKSVLDKVCITIYDSTKATHPLNPALSGNNVSSVLKIAGGACFFMSMKSTISSR